MSIPQKPLEKNQQYSINKKNIFKIFSSTNKVESNKKDIPQSPLFSIIKSEKNKFERTKKKIFFKSEKINTIIKNGKESPNANKKIIKFNVTNNIDGNDLISYYGKNLIGKWKNDEHQRFIEGVKKYGNDWSLVQKYVRTRTIIQIRSHAQKFMKKLKKLKIFETNNYDFSKSSLKIVHKIIKNLSNKKYNQILKLSKPLFNINEIKENKIELNKQKEKFEDNKFNNDIEFYFNENNNNKLYGDIRNYNDYLTYKDREYISFYDCFNFENNNENISNYDYNNFEFGNLIVSDILNNQRENFSFELNDSNNLNNNY